MEGGVVYYLMSQYGGVVKIGTTVDVPRRMARMPRAQPAMIPNVVATELGGVEVERARHLQFRHAHQVGEWFWLTDDLRAHIRSLGGDL